MRLRLSASTTSAVSLATLATFLLLAACTSTPQAKGPPTVTSGTEPGCALGVSGAQAALADAPNGGVAITVTSAARTDEIRVRARDAATKNGPDAHQGLGHEGRHGDGGKHGLQAVQLPPVRTAVEDVPGGARIELTPVDVADRARLKQRVEERVTKMNANCD